MTVGAFDQKKALGAPYENRARGSAPLRVLVVSFSFPPDAEVGGKRVARLCRYLPEFGIQPVVLTVDERFYNALDRSYRIPDGIELVRTSLMRTPLDWYSKWAQFRAAKRQAQPTVNRSEAENVPAHAGRGSTKGLRAQVRALFEMPNENWAWYWHAVKAAESVIKKGNVSAIFSSAPPWTCHLIARSLKRTFHIPWVADFRDPWTFEPWRPPVPAWRDYVDSLMESGIVHEANKVISVIEGVREEFRKKYPDVTPDKFATITNGFEGEMSIIARAKRSPRLILHLGSLYGGRRVDTFCAAASRLIDRGRITPDSIRIEFVGDVDAQIRSAAERSGASLLQRGILHFRARVPFDEGQQLLRNADLLLIFQGNHPFSVTAKIYEYFATGTPILAVAKTGAISSLVSETNTGVCVDPDDVSAIEVALMRTLEMPRLGENDLERIWEQFHFRNLAGRLSQVLTREVHKRNV